MSETETAIITKWFFLFKALPEEEKKKKRKERILQDLLIKVKYMFSQALS